jgi:hypothetical protein
MNDLTSIAMSFVIWLFFCVLVGRAAFSFHRSPAFWSLLAFVLSPLGAIVLLFIVGEVREDASLQEKEERIRSEHPEIQDVRQAAQNETQCPHCGAEINPVTGHGLHSPRATPWLLICSACLVEIEPEV